MPTAIFKHSYPIIVWMMLGCLLNSCGFHLRGTADIPKWLHHVAIIAPETEQGFVTQLKSVLQTYNIQVNSEPSLADYWIIIEQEDFQKHIDGVSSGTTSRQYQLIYTLRFKLQKNKGKELIPARSLIISRQSTLNANLILGSNEEETLQKSEMQRDAAIQMLNQISIRVPNPPH